jgi:hypothetical protein
MADPVIGMMEGAFFVPKGEILSWLNNMFGVSGIELLTKAKSPKNRTIGDWSCFLSSYGSNASW